MKVAIIGAGMTGLTTAYRLSQKGHQVIVFEKENYVGGLTAGFREKNWNWHLEHFFHHLFVSDHTAKKLIAELNLARKLFYRHPKTSIYLNGKISQFDSPFAILTSHFSLDQKLQIGLVTAYLKTTNNWKKFEKITATRWLKKFYGEKTYQILWEPLLKSKFGQKANEISMAWFWARIKKRSVKLGYLEGGFQTLIDKLAAKIKTNGGEILLKHEIKNLNDLAGQEQKRFDRILVTTPISTFLRIAPSLPKAYRDKFGKLKMIGAINLILTLKEKFLKDGIYWLNINEPGFPFVAVVEHTNFVKSKHYGHHHILYVGGYYPQSHRYFRMSKQQVLKEFLPYLQKINPKFNQLSAIPGLAPRSGAGSYQLSANLHSQPIIPTNYSKLIPPFKTPLPGVYLANMQQIYPWDRGVNYAIELGEKVSNEILKNE